MKVNRRNRDGFQDLLLVFLVALVLAVMLLGWLKGLAIFLAAVAGLLAFNLLIIRPIMVLMGRMAARSKQKAEPITASHGTALPRRS